MMETPELVDRYRLITQGWAGYFGVTNGVVTHSSSLCFFLRGRTLASVQRLAREKNWNLALVKRESL